MKLTMLDNKDNVHKVRPSYQSTVDFVGINLGSYLCSGSKTHVHGNQDNMTYSHQTGDMGIYKSKQYNLI